MPTYTFVREDTGEIKEFVMSFKTVPTWGKTVKIEGIKWKRVMEDSPPQGAVDLNVDPFNRNKFVEKTGAGSKGSMRDLWARSEEMSQKRAAKRDGKDPVKEKYFEDYSKQRRGTPHPSIAANKEFII